MSQNQQQEEIQETAENGQNGRPRMNIHVILLGVIVLMAVLSLVLRWRIGKLTDNFRQQQQQQGGPYRSQRREGDVSIRIDSEQTEKRISDDVGDYVDFVEEKNND